jgi:hypothetical protein
VNARRPASVHSVKDYSEPGVLETAGLERLREVVEGVLPEGTELVFIVRRR